MGTVYLIHFDRSIGSQHPRGRARHYIGYVRTGRLADRLEEHAQGFGSCLMRAVVEQGVDWELVRVWNRSSRNDERRLKNRKQSKAFCPYCMVRR